jgi:hypothetical protein
MAKNKNKKANQYNAEFADEVTVKNADKASKAVEKANK